MNTQITEDYVSFEVAKLLKEKGFDEPTCGFYYDNYTEKLLVSSPSNHNGSINTITAPSQSLVMRWLREVHKVHITISPYLEEELILDEPIPNFKYSNYICKENEFWDVAAPVTGFDTYEQAAEAAIKYCLTNLI